MTILDSLKSEFHTAFPRLASGKYVHFLMVRHSQSFPVFQTDGVLNVARTQAGLETQDKFSRLVLFKRKQTTPERLAGRELLRSLGLTTADKDDKEKFCEYNGEGSCKKCPDCIIYGFAIGDSGSERSKVYSDSAFSLSPYEQSHKSFTFNAPFEGGTMSEAGTMRSSINELDHILPEINFPTVETLRDPTYEGFIYVLGNLLRTRRYGAQESRTGTMTNHLIGITFSDGEIFSNLHFTQALYDALKDDLSAPIDEVRNKAQEVAETLLTKEPVRKTQQVFGPQLDDLLSEVTAIYQDDTQLQAVIGTLYQQTTTYAETYGAISGKKGKRK
ncbi:type I-D CRISPR-associated protein Cas7/Csc2 [Nodosilinea sp. LEGE 07298]|uniref:type I-D CRISPR-associated protein Cas7/Csc2 n=1 Tax=Nodosilinea sp. LEGE 07298 TaxID=2777970 RepID=UPI0018818238|nr:type I-D CRISPR-associated protein Cas7/Csc2 [Nodosilinea sp. LEGE 07298]MBE9111598.1 type I-D CRISPR-associated protein Cas7/Csc2 [Nodosilinea sp. LEGE 07298]